ncbi:hypothetical protein LTR50_004551 [Elasticomyces elasticus]|nr:hypothetical protein LTR50_004551 [Elasticomyces elasticus]
MNLNVRTATAADVGPLLSLIGSAYRGEESRKGWTTEADLLTGDRIDEAGLLAKITEPDGVMLLATDGDNAAASSGSGGALVACCELLRRNYGLGYFGLFAVEPRRQGGGLGKRVLRIAESYAREMLGMERLEMQVIWTRAELIAWGYVRTGEKRPFPYEQLVSGARALRDDLYFEILEKDLVSSEEAISVV